MERIVKKLHFSLKRELEVEVPLVAVPVKHLSLLSTMYLGALGSTEELTLPKCDRKISLPLILLRKPRHSKNLITTF